MPQRLSQLLRDAIELELPHLKNVGEAASLLNDGRPGSWSRKEELGHLIDSATNNHMRFVLATIAGEFRGEGYAQDQWVKAHGYQEIPWDTLVPLWYQYNVLLAHVVGRIAEGDLANPCRIGSSVQTLGFIIEDYVLHMRHHLDHLLARGVVTPYPA